MARRSSGAGLFSVDSIKRKMKPLKVILLIEWLELGGAERQAVMLAKGLRQFHGVDAQIWSIGTNSGHGKEKLVAKLCSEYEIPCFESPVFIPDEWWKWPIGLYSFGKILRKENPDVLLSYWNKPNITAAFIWRLAGAKSCIWGQRDEGRKRPPFLLEKIAIFNTSLFISNSEVGCQFLINSLKIKKNKIFKIHNGIDLLPPMLTLKEWRKQYSISLDAFVVAMVANMHSYKDHITLLHGWALFLKEVKNEGIDRDFVLVLAGKDYGYRKKIEDLICELGIDYSVKLLGGVADTSSLYNAIDCCVHSSLYEGLPNSILEAMYFGVPTYGTDIPGIREIFGSFFSTNLLTQNNPVSIKDKLMFYLKLDENSIKKIQINSKNYIHENFSTKKLASESYKVIINSVKNKNNAFILKYIHSIFLICLIFLINGFKYVLNRMNSFLYVK